MVRILFPFGRRLFQYGHMRALMLWMTYLAGLESRRNEEYIQNLQNRLETGNRQLFKRNKYFFLPQNREVRRSKFAGELFYHRDVVGAFLAIPHVMHIWAVSQILMVIAPYFKHGCRHFMGNAVFSMSKFNREPFFHLAKPPTKLI